MYSSLLGLSTERLPCLLNMVYQLLQPLFLVKGDMGKPSLNYPPGPYSCHISLLSSINTNSINTMQQNFFFCWLWKTPKFYLIYIQPGRTECGPSPYIYAIRLCLRQEGEEYVHSHWLDTCIFPGSMSMLFWVNTRAAFQGGHHPYLKRRR